MATSMTVQCPSCDTAFPVDPEKIPEGGVRTQCTVCETYFRVDRPREDAGAPPAPEDIPAADATSWDDGATETSWEVPFEDTAVGGEPDAEVSEFQPVGAFEDEADDDSAVGELPVLEGTEVYEEVHHPDVALEEALEPEVEEVEPLEAMEAGDVEDGVVESAAVAEAGADDDWSGDLGDDWVVETEDTASFGDVPLEVERLDTVEEQLRSIQSGEQYEGYTAEEVILTPEDLNAPLGEPVAETEEPSAWEEDSPSVEEAPAAEPAPATGFQFGRRDPHEKARRLARVLVSDMITYNPERHARALEAGSLPEDFDDEIQKSWSEYVEQVGHELAESTPYWTDALNEILAKGEPLF